MAFIDDLKILMSELRTAIDNHDHYAAEEIAQRIEQLLKGYDNDN